MCMPHTEASIVVNRPADAIWDFGSDFANFPKWNPTIPVAEVEGVARGNPGLRAGTPVSVGVVAEDFVGRYILIHMWHVFDARGYRTSFEVSGC